MVQCDYLDIWCEISKHFWIYNFHTCMGGNEALTLNLSLSSTSGYKDFRYVRGCWGTNIKYFVILDLLSSCYKDLCDLGGCLFIW